MFYQILILYLFYSPLINSVESQKLERFFCDNLQSDDLNRLDRLKRFVRNDDKIYFIYQNQIIFTRLFEIDEKELFYFNAETMVVTGFYQQLINETDHLDGIPDGNRVIGHFYNADTKKTYEFYKVGYYSVGYSYAYELNFNDTLAKRDRYLSIDKIETKKINLKEILETYRDDVKYFDLVQEHVDKNIVIFYKKYSFDINYEYGTNSYTDSDDNRWQLPKYFVAYRSNQRDILQGNDEALFIISIDEEAVRINFGTYLFKEGKRTKFRKTSMSFKEFFSCHVQFKTEWEIKGIFYDKQIKTYFVFINRFYLRISKLDLISNEFKLSNEMFENNAYDIHIEDEELNQKFKFSILWRRWIYAVGDLTYFRSHIDTYEIKINYNDSRLVIKESNFGMLGKCFRQSLVIEGHFFCIDEDDYFTMSSHGYPLRVGYLSEIFEKSKIGWDKTQILSLIFNYKDGQVVFMTLSHTFVLEYKNFKIINSYKKLIYDDPNADENLIKTKSCIFDSETCEPPPRVNTKKTGRPFTESPISTSSDRNNTIDRNPEDDDHEDDESDFEKEKKKRSISTRSFFDFYDYLVILLNLILILILIITYCVIRETKAPNNSKVSYTMYPLRKEIPIEQNFISKTDQNESIRRLKSSSMKDNKTEKSIKLSASSIKSSPVSTKLLSSSIKSSPVSSTKSNLNKSKKMKKNR